MAFLLGFNSKGKVDTKKKVIETVETLCERISTSSVLEDRRDAVRGLKGLSRKYRVEVGAQSLLALFEVLVNDYTDSDIIQLSLDTLYNVMDDCSEPLVNEDEEEDSVHIPSDLGVQFTEMFLKSDNCIGVLLQLLEEYDFKVKFGTVKLLMVMLKNSPSQVQQQIINSALGISRLIDLLSESRDVIRNESILLLTHLTNNNTAIQKIVAFENGFEKIFSIIQTEGYINGDIVVEDSLNLLLSIIHGNSSNQSFFRESGFISQLSNFFELQAEDWAPQKMKNINKVFQVIRELASPTNSHTAVVPVQKTILKVGLLKILCEIIIDAGFPDDVLINAIMTVSDLIRGNRGNQNFFESVHSKAQPDRNAIVILLMSMVNEKQTLILRYAILYCFQCYMYRNEAKQADVVSTLLPSKIEVSAVTPGQFLCGGLFSREPISTWLCSLALSYTLNQSQKEQLLRVQLTTSIGNPAISLLQHIATIATKSSTDMTSRFGCLILLSTWLHNCSAAVAAFLKHPQALPYLIGQVSDCSANEEEEALLQGLSAFILGLCLLYIDESGVGSFDKKGIRIIIEKRIGIDVFADKLSFVSRHEKFAKCSRNPQLKVRTVADLVLDYEFIGLFKLVEVQIQKTLSFANAAHAADGDHIDELLEKYKKVIREQDEKIQTLEKKFTEVNFELQASNEQLKCQTALLGKELHLDARVINCEEFLALENNYSEILSEISSLRNQVVQYAEDLSQQKSESLQMSQQQSEERERLQWYESQYPPLQQTYEALYQQYTYLQSQFNEQFDPEGRIQELQQLSALHENNAAELSQHVASLQLSIEGLQSEQQNYTTSNDDLRRQCEQLNNELNEATRLLEIRESELKQAEEMYSQIQRVPRDLPNPVNEDLYKELEELRESKFQLMNELENLRSDQDDLLVLVADQDSKLTLYTKHLKALDCKVDFDDSSSSSSSTE